MEKTLFLFLLCTAVNGDIGKPIFFSTGLNWTEAQKYCRQHHVDLFFIGSQNDQDKLPKVAGPNILDGWIGLHRNISDIDGWRWSGGGENVAYLNWKQGQPDNYNHLENFVNVQFDGKWNDISGETIFPFYCLSINLVKVTKTWEEALEHCRGSHSDLPSLTSETENLLALSEIQQHNHITERVWIGLRYLGNCWLWVNGDPLVYQAWPLTGEQDHLCPIWKRCGALTKEGQWENWDCQEKLNFICS